MHAGPASPMTMKRSLSSDAQLTRRSAPFHRSTSDSSDKQFWRRPMPDEALAFVQFIHPGGEHAPDEGDIKSWNLGMHRRKFMLAEGDYIYEGQRQHGRIAFWGEWEPPSRVV